MVLAEGFQQEIPAAQHDHRQTAVLVAPLHLHPDGAFARTGHLRRVRSPWSRLHPEIVHVARHQNGGATGPGRGQHLIGDLGNKPCPVMIHGRVQPVDDHVATHGRRRHVAAPRPARNLPAGGFKSLCGGPAKIAAGPQNQNFAHHSLHCLNSGYGLQIGIHIPQDRKCGIHFCMDNLDWTLTRSFLAVAETGSLSAAARKLNLSQPTLSRQIAQLEAQLGPLFHRQPRGLDLTDTAAALLPHARDMANAAARLTLAAHGREQALTGSVRITASRVVAHHLLPAILAEMRRAEPGIQLDLVASDSTEDLLHREADIALRMYRPDQPDVIATHVADLPLGLYAAHSYVARRGAPGTMAELMAHDFIGFDRSDLQIRLMASLGVPAKREDFAVRCDDQIVYWNLVRAGLGIGGMQQLVAQADPTVQRIAPFLTLPALPVWLTAHQALRHTPRIRRVFDHLAAAFRAL